MQIILFKSIQLLCSLHFETIDQIHGFYTSKQLTELVSSLVCPEITASIARLSQL